MCERYRSISASLFCVCKVDSFFCFIRSCLELSYQTKDWERYTGREVDDMAQIKINNVTFGYEGSYDNIFENLSFSVDTDWRLGFIGRNGKGRPHF